MAKYKQGDFFSWDDDLDLDILLGEYTCDELENNFERKDTLCEYQCPQCDKEYRSISGFRGHVLKKHNMNLKANNYKKSDVGQDKQTKNMYQEEDNRLNEVFPDAYIQSSNNLLNDPLYNFLCDSNTRIAKNCQTNEVKLYFSSIMDKCFSAQRYSTTCEREVLMKRVHSVRTDSNVIEQGVKVLKESVQDIDITDLDIESYIQDMIMDLICQIFKQRIILEKRTSAANVTKPLTEATNKVIYYISGYIIKALQKKYSKTMKDREAKLDAVNGLINNVSEQTFTKIYASWYDKKNRGGLKKPSDNMFFVVREFENIARSHSDMHLSELKETILDSFMVGYYQGELFPISEDDIDASSSYIEDMVNIFVTIRGFARAKYLQRLLIKGNKEKSNTKQAKASSSLRSTLKDLSNCRK